MNADYLKTEKGLTLEGDTKDAMDIKQPTALSQNAAQWPSIQGWRFSGPEFATFALLSLKKGKIFTSKNIQSSGFLILNTLLNHLRNFRKKPNQLNSLKVKTVHF